MPACRKCQPIFCTHPNLGKENSSTKGLLWAINQCLDAVTGGGQHERGLEIALLLGHPLERESRVACGISVRLPVPVHIFVFHDGASPKPRDKSSLQNSSRFNTLLSTPAVAV